MIFRNFNDALRVLVGGMPPPTANIPASAARAAVARRLGGVHEDIEPGSARWIQRQIGRMARLQRVLAGDGLKHDKVRYQVLKDEYLRREKQLQIMGINVGNSRSKLAELAANWRVPI